MAYKTIPGRPSFDSLPLDKYGPPGNAWGLYGADDELGALNMLTAETVVAAAQEIKTGERVSLDWHLDKPSRPSFDRPPFQVKLRNSPGKTINDDELHFNTQCSTQWDGFRHFGTGHKHEALIQTLTLYKGIKVPNDFTEIEHKKMLKVLEFSVLMVSMSLKDEELN